jgi:hypothetical protein
MHPLKTFQCERNPLVMPALKDKGQKAFFGLAVRCLLKAAKG